MVEPPSKGPNPACEKLIKDGALALISYLANNVSSQDLQKMCARAITANSSTEMSNFVDGSVMALMSMIGGEGDEQQAEGGRGMMNRMSIVSSPGSTAIHTPVLATPEHLLTLLPKTLPSVPQDEVETDATPPATSGTTRGNTAFERTATAAGARESENPMTPALLDDSNLNSQLEAASLIRAQQEQEDEMETVLLELKPTSRKADAVVPQDGPSSPGAPGQKRAPCWDCFHCPMEDIEVRAVAEASNKVDPRLCSFEKPNFIKTVGEFSKLSIDCLKLTTERAGQMRISPET
eukprot:CAMPEP_0113940258 /NCGR_PEP_ID=MMETSP1339-20121228/6420_1 /TAXON_ID=94617 /ORGANISM="Fibrocapsa japonica" /LENGTH=292 /DNA_ID=CAMNT_0000944023 /DNA_START=80 /DNA_END=958 /DNA_ORIENTATION=+ /assembly_acc=CAM_ASM_000762